MIEFIFRNRRVLSYFLSGFYFREKFASILCSLKRVNYCVRSSVCARSCVCLSRCVLWCVLLSGLCCRIAMSGHVTVCAGCL